MQPSQALLVAAGGAWDASLNHYDVGGGRVVTTQQIDEFVYVVGKDDFNVARYTLTGWLEESKQADASYIECDDAVMAWELLRLIRANCLVWQCGGCDSWIFTSNCPRVGRLQCSTCGDGGVDFRHADRAVGPEDD